MLNVCSVLIVPILSSFVVPIVSSITFPIIPIVSIILIVPIVSSRVLVMSGLFFFRPLAFQFPVDGVVCWAPRSSTHITNNIRVDTTVGRNHVI